MKPEKFDPKEKNDKSETPRTVGKKNRDMMQDAKITQKNARAANECSLYWSIRKIN